MMQDLVPFYAKGDLTCQVKKTCKLLIIYNDFRCILWQLAVSYMFGHLAKPKSTQ